MALNMNDREFLTDVDSALWKSVLLFYQKVMKGKASKKTKKEAEKELLKLDDWYQSELPGIISSRSEPHITLEELVDLVKWKLSRGKFRPRLVDLARSNPAAEVEKLTKEAFKVVSSQKVAGLQQIRKAIDKLSKLKGIGPATASAILTVGCPGQAAFMADEPTYLVLGSSSLKYNIAEYMVYMGKVTDLSHRLQVQDEEFGWSPHKVELVLWTHCVARTLGIDISVNNNNSSCEQSKPTTAAAPPSKRKAGLDGRNKKRAKT